MNDKNQKNNNMSDQGFLFLVTCVLICAGWYKFRVPILMFYYKWFYVIAFLISLLILALCLKIKKMLVKWWSPSSIENKVLSKNDDEDSVFAGFSDKGKRVFVKKSYRTMHTQVIGTTNAGKTESVILPWAIDDIKKKRGLLIIDGKSDRSLLNKLYAYAKQYHREKDVKILSLCNVEMSCTFNPFAKGSPLEVTERVFNGLTFENEYFRTLQYETLLYTLLIFEANKIVPTPLRIVQALKAPRQLKHLAGLSKKQAYIDWVKERMALPPEEREQRSSGLVSQLQVLSVGETATIFNAEESDIDLDEAMAKGHIVYCQLPVLKIPTLGKVVGKLVLQCLQSGAASRHLGIVKNKDFFSVYLDDFSEYLTEGFVSLLSKSRSANVGVVFAHQALGDLGVLGDSIKNSILSNTNLKVFMRTNEPESAEYFSAVIGTTAAAKLTERQKSGLLGNQKTGDGSVRSVEEFKFHPNIFKQNFGPGDAVIVLPDSSGNFPVRIKFRMSPDLDAPEIPNVEKCEPSSLPPVPDEDEESSEQEKQKSQLKDGSTLKDILADKSSMEKVS